MFFSELALTRYFKPMSCFHAPFEALIITLMVGAGSLITIILKWCNQLDSLNSIGNTAKFSHPLLQSTMGYLGELFCIALFYTQMWRRKSYAVTDLNRGKNINFYI